MARHANQNQSSRQTFEVLTVVLYFSLTNEEVPHKIFGSFGRSLLGLR